MLGQTRGQGNSGDETQMMMMGWWGWWGVSVWGLASSSRAVVIRSDSVNKPFIIVIILESRTIHHPFSEHLWDEDYYAPPAISFAASALLLSLCDASSRDLTLTARLSLPGVIMSVANGQSVVNPHTWRTWHGHTVTHDVDQRFGRRWFWNRNKGKFIYVSSSSSSSSSIYVSILHALHD